MHSPDMSLVLTPELCRAGYEFLRATRPFNRWKLPPGDEVHFKIGRDKNTRGWIVCEPGKATITVSSNCISQTVPLLALLAHEMVHLYQHTNHTYTSSEHNAEFWQLADRVCKHHREFDRKLF
jgi:hypothetical protein